MTVSTLPSSDSSHELLAQISTIWSNVLKAHGGPDQADAVEQSRFFDRYHRAILRYLIACVHEEEVASDLFQEFALRFIRGDFAQVRPRTGSFRQYIKTSLMNLVRDYQAKHNQSPLVTNISGVVSGDADPSSSAFDEGLRDELLSRAWKALSHAQTTGGPPFYTALKAKVNYPEWNSSELASHLAHSLGRSEIPTEPALRKLIQRAREAFADHLLNQVQLVIGNSSWEQVEEELAALELLPYCSHALNDRRGAVASRGTTSTDGHA